MSFSDSVRALSAAMTSDAGPGESGPDGKAWRRAMAAAAYERAHAARAAQLGASNRYEPGRMYASCLEMLGLYDVRN